MEKAEGREPEVRALLTTVERGCRRSGGGPEPRERSAVRRFAELLERALADLADALAGDPHERADLLEGHRLGAFLEPVVEIEDLALAGGQVAGEDPVDELPHQLEVGYVLDLGAIDAGEAFAERAGLAVGAIDRGI